MGFGLDRAVGRAYIREAVATPYDPGRRLRPPGGGSDEGGGGGPCSVLRAP
jgi:hypothetical protein